MSAEEMYELRTADRSFMNRLRAVGVRRRSDVVVVADSTPIGEVLARVDAQSVAAVLDEDEPHGFTLVRIRAAAP